MSNALYNLAAMTVASTGTGTITLGAAATINGVKFLSFSGAGVPDGQPVYYSILDIGNSEVGLGTYTASGTTLTRGPITSTNSNAAINMTAAAIVRITPVTSQLREILTGARTYYVRTDGSDSNTGLANSAGGAFLTLQKAFNVISSTLDVAGQTVTISVGAGTYSAGIDFSAGWVGAGAIVVSGAPSTISVASANCFQNTGVLPGSVTIQNLTLVVTGLGGIAISHTGVGTINIGTGVTFGDMAGGDQIFAQGASAYVTCSSSYTISGGGRSHCFARDGGTIDLYNGGSGMVTTVSASITYASAFVVASGLGYLKSINRTYSIGAFTVTGTRYSITTNSVVNTNGGSTSLFPGTVAGTTATGGQYA